MASRRAAVAGAAVALVVLAGEGQAVAQASELRISLLTFSPGSHPFLAFGHNALWVHDPRLPGEDTDLVYNFGTFAFGSPWVIVDFARGELHYWLSLATLDWTVDTYGAEGREVRSQELALSFAEADRLERDLLQSARPENRDYSYGYIGDNCATRVRDAIDRALGGGLRASIDRAAGPITFRAEVSRVLSDRPLFGEAVQAALGPALDRPMSPWEAAFLPDRFSEALARVVRTTGPGEPVSLVKSEKTLRAGARWFPRESPPDHRPLALAIGGFSGALLVLAGRRWPRALGVAAAALGAVLGLTGALLFALGLVHPLLRWNVNLLHTAPCALWLVRCGLGVARREAGAVERARRVASLGLCCSLVGLALPLVKITPQPLGAFAALLAPLWLGLWAGLRTAKVGG